MSKRRRLPKHAASAKSTIETAAGEALDWLEPMLKGQAMSEIERLHRVSRAVTCLYQALRAVGEIRVEGEGQP